MKKTLEQNFAEKVWHFSTFLRKNFPILAVVSTFREEHFQPKEFFEKSLINCKTLRAFSGNFLVILVKSPFFVSRGIYSIIFFQKSLKLHTFSSKILSVSSCHNCFNVSRGNFWAKKFLLLKNEIRKYFFELGWILFRLLLSNLHSTVQKIVLGEKIKNYSR